MSQNKYVLKTITPHNYESCIDHKLTDQSILTIDIKESMN